MRITFLVSSLSGGGAEAVCVNVANGLAKRGWQVDLLVLHLNEAAYIDRLSSSVNLVNLKAKRARYAAPALLWYFLKHKPKVLLVFKYELVDLSIILKFFFRLNLKIIARNISVYSESQAASKLSPIKKAIEWIFGHSMTKIDCVINQSFAMEKDFLQVFPSLSNRSFVIHNPVAYHIEEYVRLNGIRENRDNNYVLCVGRLEEVKGFHYAIEAFSMIAKKFPSLRLVFVGAGSLKESLQEISLKLNVADRVDFEGLQKDVIPYYEKASLTLLTSFYEGFPNVLIESIVLGTPIVSFDCPSGPREILEDGKWGKLVPARDVRALAEAISETLKNPSEFDLSVRAEFFGVDKAIDKYEKIINK
jgi:glycosyltransferase involved in cell wall biosynthesis